MIGFHRLAYIPVLLGILVSFAFCQQETPVQKLNVAVLDLNISGGIPEIYKETLSDRLRMELVNTGRFNVVERNAMEDILSEQGMQLSGCTSDECVVEVGRLLGVDKMIAGSLGKVGNTHSVILRMIDVGKGVIDKSRNVDCACPIDEVMSRKLREAARMMADLDISPEEVQEIRDRVRDSRSALPKSLLWPGWGQIAIGRKTPGFIYAIGELGAVAFLGYSVMDYNAKVQDYKDAKEEYDTAQFGTMRADEADMLYREKVESHQAAEDASGMVMVAAGVAAGVYLWNIIDGLVFTVKIEKPAMIGLRNSEIKPAVLCDRNGRPAPGVAVGFRFNLTNR